MTFSQSRERKIDGQPARVESDEPFAWRLLSVMQAAAHDAARYIQGRAAGLATLEWRSKSRSDFVSDVDTAAEARIHAVLLDAVGGGEHHVTFIGEESSPDAALGAGLTFVVDPLDGTTNFLHGYPWYAVSIGALLDGELVAGVIENVTTSDVFTAVRGGGAFRNGEPIAVSTIDEPTRALVGTGIPFKHLQLLSEYQRQLDAVVRGTAGVRRAGSAALDLADVACGRFDAFWELRLAPWDVAAGLLLIREAGGIVTDLDGEDAPVAHGAVVAGNPSMHDWVLRAIQRV